jgi:hypothetical protein
MKTRTAVGKMISELPDPQNAWGKGVKLYRPAISYISICKGLFSPIRAERKLIQAEYTRSELNIRDVAEQGGCRG